MHDQPDERLQELLRRCDLTTDAGRAGPVRLAMGKQLEVLPVAEGERRVREHTATHREHVRALKAARVFEIDDVIDPAETRGVIAAMLAAAGPVVGGGPVVGTW
ncbi:MAG TPA: hypothetical protein PLT68_11305 [Actinomycetota bacterium]|nr:hypothetical protein [Actinomycetota bacterium]